MCEALQLGIEQKVPSTEMEVRGYLKQHHDMIALQKHIVAPAKKQTSSDTADIFDDNSDGANAFGDNGAVRPAEPELVLLPLAL